MMFSFRRFIAVLKARNLEFWRDRAALGWNLLFPFLLVAGFAFVFSGEPKAEYKVGVLQQSTVLDTAQHPLLTTRFVEFVPYQAEALARQRLAHHQIDLVLDLTANRYVVNPDSAKGYLVEKILLQQWPGATREEVTGQAIRYVDFVLPGILGMNMMFSCLFGVGYVLVRYRKNSVLKRLQATPLTALEFVGAQVVSRLAIVLAIAGVVFVSCQQLFGLMMLGSYALLLLVAALGALSMIALALLIASRLQSEELTGGLLNMTSWPMMILSGVWFSLEGAPQAVQWFAQLFPLTHLVSAARAVMLDGAGFADVSVQLGVMAAMSLVFLAAAAALFRWAGDGR
ncbi:ABC transporter permease [Rheinheimera tilapiae]|jgi:ABC-2 type transport system permease protein|uniref:Transport permease protein n=1 Tax=Rheinheimera tilapiae TaxID=875043 RepID=A0ABV6BBJ1_9GAMM